MVVFIELFNNRCRVLGFENREECSVKEIQDWIIQNEGFPVGCLLLHNGHILDNDAKLALDQGDCFIRCHLPLVGGKGGFGSMLRAIGAQIEKTTNREACRDLSGRRMRDVNDEKKIADWLAKKSEREEEKVKRKQERLEKLKSPPRHVFEDGTTYTSQLQENMDSVEDALQKGLKSTTGNPSSSSLGKRKANEKVKKTHKKKQKLWLEIDEDLSSDSDEGDMKSSCSSITDSEDITSSEMSANSALGHISEAEVSDSQGSTESSTSEIKKHQSHLTSERKACTTSASAISVLCDTSAERCKSSLENSKENENNDLAKDAMPNSDVNVTGLEVKPNIEKSELHSSVSLPLDLNKYQSKEELEVLGLDALKSALMALGLKCGGTLEQRAERLFLTKGIPREELDPSLLAKSSGKKQKGNKKRTQK